MLVAMFPPLVRASRLTVARVMDGVSQSLKTGDRRGLLEDTACLHVQHRERWVHNVGVSLVNLWLIKPVLTGRLKG